MRVKSGKAYSLDGRVDEGVCQNYGYFLGGPNNQDYSIVIGSVWGLLFWETTHP